MRILKFLKLSKKKAIILAVLIIIGFLGFYFSGQKKQTPLQFTQVKRQDIRSSISASGTLTGQDTANLKFKGSGKIAFINVKAGDKVWQSQVLAGLDAQDLSIALQQAQNTFVAKDAAAKRVEDDVKNHDKDETFLQKETRTAAQTVRDNAFDSVKAAEKNLQDAFVVSPINGIVTQVNFIPGQIAGDNVLQVVDTSGIYFDSEVDEADISKPALNQKAEVILDAYSDKTFIGIVSQIQPQTTTTSTGATVIVVRIKLDDPKITFISGLSGQASIITSEAQNVLTIPQEAVRDDNTIYLSDLKPKKVVQGIKSDIDVEIKEGLKENERVLLNPPASSLGLQNRSNNPLQRVLRIFGGGRPGGPH